ncbi:MAG: hypothetical protein ACXWMC_06365 [Syntrophales bacterium]
MGNQEKVIRHLVGIVTGFLVVFISCINIAVAASWYVRPTGGGGTGTSWTNAWNGLNNINWGSVSCGDSIWVAGGTYTQDLSPQKNCTSGSRLYIRRARSDATECTGSAGWSSGYDATVHQTGGAGISFSGNYNYIVVSGRTSSSGGSNGWWIDFSGLTYGPGIEWPNGSNASYNTIEYMDLQGPGAVTYTSDGRGIDATPFSSANGNTFSHLKIWGWESGVYNAGIDGSTFEYIEMFDIMAANWSSYHPNGIYISGSNNGIVRYSKFHKGPGGNGVGEGIFFEQSGGCSNWQIYGNIFYDLTNSGLKAIEITSVVPNMKIWNNTFDNVLAPLYTQANPGSGSELKNNLFYASGSGYSWGTTSNNLQISSGTLFVNRAAKDYHIVSSTGTNYPRNAGAALTQDGYINYDMDGNQRGADGTWDIGAYEYVSGAPDTIPPTISSVSASSITQNSATITWTTNEASDSQVEYGLTTSYGSSTTLDTSMVTSHSQGLSWVFCANEGQLCSFTGTKNVRYGANGVYVSKTLTDGTMCDNSVFGDPLPNVVKQCYISGLLASQLYHYRVKSKDAAGNLATSGDYTFTTAGGDTGPPATPKGLRVE